MPGLYMLVPMSLLKNKNQQCHDFESCTDQHALFMSTIKICMFEIDLTYSRKIDAIWFLEPFLD